MSTVPHSLEPVHFSPQTIYCGDCLDILAQFPANSVDLIYIDPPFNSNRNYEVFWGDTQEKRAFDDRYGDALAYCAYMRPRVEQLHRVLKTTGSFYYHCDWHASHYIKVMLDEIFGFQNFQNEITWRRTFAKGDSRKRFPRVSDTLYFYTKTSHYGFNPVVAGHSEEYIQKYYRNKDANGRLYQLTSITSPQPRPNMMYEYKGFPSPPLGWRYSRETMERLDAEGRIWLPEDKTKRPRLIRYLDEQKGTLVTDLWNDIAVISAHDKERLGYPTQKPLALLERIIKASSNPGDIVLDAFCGCGTALVAARQLGRRFVGIDISPTSVNVMGTRLEEVCGMQVAPPSMGAQEVADSWNAGLASTGQGPVPPGISVAQPPPAAGSSGGVPPPDEAIGRRDAAPTGDAAVGRRDAAPTTAYYRFSNLPRSREQLRALPGFEFENWAVLQLGEVLRQHGHRIYAQANRAKVGDLGLDGRIYLADKVSLPVKRGDLPLMESAGLRSERQAYLPIQVKNTDQVGRPEIDKFAHALQRDGRQAGFFIGWEFSRDVHKEIERLQRLPEGERRFIFTVPVDKLIAETFNLELLGLFGG